MMKNKSLRFKFILFFSGSSIIIFLLVMGFNYHFSERMIMEHIRQNAENVTMRAVNKIEIVLESVKKIGDGIAFSLEGRDLVKEDIVDLLG